MDSGTLAVRGADLYHQVHGSGPVLLLIGGSNVDTGLYEFLVDGLAHRHTVVTYDRRGNSRSRLTDPPGEQLIEEHAEDAHRVLRAFTDGPAKVFGSGTGATIGLDLLARHPEQVDLLIAHEPFLAGLLPDPEQWRATFDDIHDLYLRSGRAAATEELVRLFGLSVPPVPSGELPGPIVEMLDRVHRNVDFNLAWELRSFSRYEADLAALRGAPVCPAAGAEGPQTPFYRTTAVLAEHLGLPLRELPAGHMGYVERPAEFAEALISLLDGA
ncbi:alpha/beta hydrolase [Streptomyces sp. SID3343]|uniref:alpha/beta fold hydrolase n=1 Tax=Streptomyces sp. SID3343 TaxID=2690260 RepID=UPI001371C5E9|nr:alpha/beta hydrolase [Streptomyces sp. SID3343]MYV99318.1 alpha/beta fold hydrolase [Streptomyces sp. SID3343]